MKIAIVGAAPSSRDLAPYHDPSWHIWACSPSNKDGPKRIDTWFELHALADLVSPQWAPWAKGYIEWMRAQKGRVMMQEVNSVVPNAERFPKDEIVAEHGPAFLSSSIAWMTALAIREKASEIGIWGVDMTAGSEYDYERPGCKYWIAKAREAGIKVFIPDESDLDFPAPLYGFGDASPMARKLKMHSLELQQRIDGVVAELNRCDQHKADLLREHAHLSGAVEEVNFIRKTFVSWSGPDLR